MTENRRFWFQAHSALWSAKRIRISFELMVPMISGGLGRESKGCRACRGPAWWICRGLHLRPFSLKLAILVKFELLYDDSSSQTCRELECPCCSDFESRQSRDKKYWFSCNAVDCITFCLLDFVVLKVGIAFWVVLVFYSIPEVYWILVLLWAVLDFGITLEWGPNLAYCLEVTLFLYANPCLHLVKWFPYFSQK